MVVVINVADPSNPTHLTDNVLNPNNITSADIVGGVDGTTGKYRGVHALLAANSELGIIPRILIAPGFTHDMPSGNANPIVSELIGIAENLRAIIIADLPNTNDKDAFDYVSDFGSARVYRIYPWVKVLNNLGNIVEEPASPRVAGLIVESDKNRGFWWSPSNLVINGIVGISKPIDFVLGDVNSKANYLNGKT